MFCVVFFIFSRQVIVNHLASKQRPVPGPGEGGPFFLFEIFFFEFDEFFLVFVCESGLSPKLGVRLVSTNAVVVYCDHQTQALAKSRGYPAVFRKRFFNFMAVIFAL